MERETKEQEGQGIKLSVLIAIRDQSKHLPFKMKKTLRLKYRQTFTTTEFILKSLFC